MRWGPKAMGRISILPAHVYLKAMASTVWKVGETGAPPTPEGLLGELALRLPGARTYAAEPRGQALCAPLSGLLADPKIEVDWGSDAPPEGEGEVVLLSPTTPDEAGRALLAALRAGELPPGAPSWALTGRGRSPLEAFRGAGAVGKVTVGGAGGSRTELRLFPIRLQALDPLRRSLTPDSKLPEGPDNLERRGEWFRNRSGKG